MNAPQQRDLLVLPFESYRYNPVVKQLRRRLLGCCTLQVHLIDVVYVHLVHHQMLSRLFYCLLLEFDLQEDLVHARFVEQLFHYYVHPYMYK